MAHVVSLQAEAARNGNVGEALYLEGIAEWLRRGHLAWFTEQISGALNATQICYLSHVAHALEQRILPVGERGEPARRPSASTTKTEPGRFIRRQKWTRSRPSTNEHGLIRQFLDDMALAAEKIENGHGRPQRSSKRRVDFARTFADKYHHFKEEHVLFVQLAQKKQGEVDAQLEALRYEHERGRSLVAGIEKCAPRIRGKRSDQNR